MFMDNISPFGQLMPRMMMTLDGDLLPPGGDPPAGDPPAIDPPPADAFSWKAKVGQDLANSPALQKFEDTSEGLKKAVESHINLEKLLGHEKVPMPKGPDDIEGIARFNKVMGVPETSAGYNLPDTTLPGEMSKLTFNKDVFAQVAKENNLTPAQANGLWKKYTEMSGSVYQQHLTAFQDTLNNNINTLRAEWGDAYASNIELGEMVIAKFADDQTMGDFLTASLSKDPAGMKFLAKIGQQFSENKVGEFQYKRQSLTPAEATAEITKIKADPKHAYGDMNAPQAEHDLAVDYVNRLIAVSLGKRK